MVAHKRRKKNSFENINIFNTKGKRVFFIVIETLLGLAITLSSLQQTVCRALDDCISSFATQVIVLILFFLAVFGLGIIIGSIQAFYTNLMPPLCQVPRHIQTEAYFQRAVSKEFGMLLGNLTAFLMINMIPLETYFEPGVDTMAKQDTI